MRRGSRARTSRDRDSERQGEHERDRGGAERGCAGGAEQARARSVDQRRGQPAGQQPDPGGAQADQDVFDEQHDGDEPRRAPDRFEQADAARLLGYPAADEHDHAGGRQHGEQPAASCQDGLHFGERLGVSVADLLPGDQGGISRRGVRVVTVGERAGRGGVVEFEVQEVGLGSGGGCHDAAHVGLGGPDQARVVGGNSVRQEAALGAGATSG